MQEWPYGDIVLHLKFLGNEMHYCGVLRKVVSVARISILPKTIARILKEWQ